MAARNVTLSADDTAAIRKLAEDADNTLGPRYPPAFQALVLVDTPLPK